MWKLKKKKKNFRGSSSFSQFFRGYWFSRLASFQIFCGYLFSRMEEKSAKFNPIKVTQMVKASGEGVIFARSDALKLPVFLNRNKEEWNFLVAGSNALSGFWEQWVFLLNDMLYRFWNLSNQWFKKRKLWSGSNSSIICFLCLTNHHLFTGFPWCLIVIHSLNSFSSIDTYAAWRCRLPERAFVLRACIFSICWTQVLT